MQTRTRQHAQHDFAFGDEQALPSHQVPFPHIAIGGDARVGEIVDPSDYQIFTRWSGAR